MTEGLRHLVLENAPASALRQLAIDEGMVTLRRSGLQKVREGLTTLDEVVRETVL
jgi:type IV pilus assembly protein PilB